MTTRASIAEEGWRDNYAQRSRTSTESSVSSQASNPSLRPPNLRQGSGTSPLARAGIRGDGLMLFITCFASLGVFLFGYDQGVMVSV